VPRTALSFSTAGVLGIVSASLLKPFFIGRPDFISASELDLIEEFVKILGVLVITRHWRHDSELVDIVLGAAARHRLCRAPEHRIAFGAFRRSGDSLLITLAMAIAARSSPGKSATSISASWDTTAMRRATCGCR
jgi:protease PrsW